ncbi:hypothetical protein [Xanthomonas sacchari]|uniref:hypothetical protein n=1 Tax=Xanthomonas sacchari TaxID=56458 RepID=UPI002254DE37|nr:hypothetical protein [Xanthomonas sacchari]MCW0370279.1 hypothetical protein [Xanthomonas sacchari]
MSSPTPIITPPPKKDPQPQPKASLLPQGIMPIRTTLKHYSTWAFATLIAAPDLYQAAGSLGMLADDHMPAALVWGIRGIAGLGLVAKFIKQQKPA